MVTQTNNRSISNNPTFLCDITGISSLCGEICWCIKTIGDVVGEIYVFADLIEFSPDGTLMLIKISDSNDGSYDTKRTISLALAPGRWTQCYVTDRIGGSAIAVAMECGGSDFVR